MTSQECSWRIAHLIFAISAIASARCIESVMSARTARSIQFRIRRPGGMSVIMKEEARLMKTLILISTLLPRATKGERNFLMKKGGRERKSEMDNATFLLLSCGLYESYFETSRNETIFCTTYGCIAVHRLTVLPVSRYSHTYILVYM